MDRNGTWFVESGPREVNRQTQETSVHVLPTRVTGKFAKRKFESAFTQSEKRMEHKELTFSWDMIPQIRFRFRSVLTLKVKEGYTLLQAPIGQLSGLSNG
ncbi:hypothetical protein PM082_024192 [Marasmius tenuissimus]|nr:hypothetical protein PM082_024192 [Marasmius tenuissimus]